MSTSQAVHCGRPLGITAGGKCIRRFMSHILPGTASEFNCDRDVGCVRRCLPVNSSDDVAFSLSRQDRHTKVVPVFKQKVDFVCEFYFVSGMNRIDGNWWIVICGSSAAWTISHAASNEVSILVPGLQSWNALHWRLLPPAASSRCRSLGSSVFRGRSLGTRTSIRTECLTLTSSAIGSRICSCQ